MKRTRKIKITTTLQRRIISLPSGLPSGLIRAHCAVCGHEVQTLAAARAASVLEVDGPALMQLVADGLVHSIRTVSGSLLICRDSLFPAEEPTRGN